MKGNLTLQILQIIGESVVTATDIVSAMLDAGYGASHWKLDRALARIKQSRRAQDLAHAEESRLRRRYADMLYKLKRDGLIVARKENVSNTQAFSLTAQGFRYFAKLIKRSQDKLPDAQYPVEKADAFTIVTFDVPEKDKRKRDWLRATLKRLNLTMIQKSVWLGKVKIPEEFLEDMKKMRILEFVEIFEISKAGSLRHVV